MNYLLFITLLIGSIALWCLVILKIGFKYVTPNYSLINKEDLEQYVVEDDLNIYKNLFNKIVLQKFSIFSAISIPLIVFYGTILDRTPNILVFIIILTVIGIVSMLLGFYIVAEVYPIEKLKLIINFKYTKQEIFDLRDMAQILYDHSDIEDERKEKNLAEEYAENLLESTCNNLNILVYNYLYTPNNQLYRKDDEQYIKKIAINKVIDEKYPELFINILKLSRNFNAVSEMTINDWENLNNKLESILTEVEQDEKDLKKKMEIFVDKHTNKETLENKNLLLKNIIE